MTLAAGLCTIRDQNSALLVIPYKLGLEVVVRSDSAGASHGFGDAIRSRGLAFPVGFDLTKPVREAS